MKEFYKVNSNLLTTTSANVLAIYMIIISFLLNLPVNISRDSSKIQVQMNTNETIEVYCYTIRDFEYDQLFQMVILLTNFLRDFGTLIAMFSFNISLVLTVTKYYSKNKKFAYTVKKRAHMKTTLDSCKMAFVLCMLSGISNFISYLYYLNLIIGKNNIIGVLVFSTFFTSSIISSMNFFVIFKFSKIFRSNFINLFQPGCQNH